MPRTRRKSAEEMAVTPAMDGVIRTIRDERVIVDSDLARIYGVQTKVLNQAVRRNREKFPADFPFQLTRAEAINLQRARSKKMQS